MTHADCKARDMRIIERRCEGFTLEEIAEIYDLTAPRICQILMRERLKHPNLSLQQGAMA